MYAGGSMMLFDDVEEAERMLAPGVGGSHGEPDGNAYLGWETGGLGVRGVFYNLAFGHVLPPPRQSGSSTAVVASDVSRLSVNGNAETVAAASKSSLAGTAARTPLAVDSSRASAAGRTNRTE